MGVLASRREFPKNGNPFFCRRGANGARAHTRPTPPRGGYLPIEPITRKNHETNLRKQKMRPNGRYVYYGGRRIEMLPRADVVRMRQYRTREPTVRRSCPRRLYGCCGGGAVQELHETPRRRSRGTGRRRARPRPRPRPNRI